MARYACRPIPPRPEGRGFSGLQAGEDVKPAFCARQLGHSVEVFLRTYSRWIDGQRDDLEMQRLEAALGDKPGINVGVAGA